MMEIVAFYDESVNDDPLGLTHILRKDGNRKNNYKIASKYAKSGTK